MIARFRPLIAWPHPETKVAQRRSRWTFKASWSDTLALLQYEIERLGGANVIIGTFHREDDIRLDGWPRSGARVPEHPGVEVSFDTAQHGRLIYATDAVETWEGNVRSIALGLASLRAVDRYGISQRGEQYAGWKALPSGTAAPVPTVAGARALLVDLAGLGNEGPMILARYDDDALYKAAAKRWHPDRPDGDGEKFVQAAAAHRLLREAMS